MLASAITRVAKRRHVIAWGERVREFHEWKAQPPGLRGENGLAERAMMPNDEWLECHPEAERQATRRISRRCCPWANVIWCTKVEWKIFPSPRRLQIDILAMSDQIDSLPDSGGVVRLPGCEISPLAWLRLPAASSRSKTRARCSSHDSGNPKSKL
jgi:hypothetical protein